MASLSDDDEDLVESSTPYLWWMPTQAENRTPPPEEADGDYEDDDAFCVEYTDEIEVPAGGFPAAEPVAEAVPAAPAPLPTQAAPAQPSNLWFYVSLGVMFVSIAFSTAAFLIWLG
jgi:hypothetical protein